MNTAALILFRTSPAPMLALFLITASFVSPSQAQDEGDPLPDSGRTSLKSTIADDGTGSIIVEAHGQLPKPPTFFSADSSSEVLVGTNGIEHRIDLTVRLIQGDAERLLPADGAVLAATIGLGRTSLDNQQSWRNKLMSK